VPGWLRFRLFTGGRFVYDGDGESPRAGPHTFWSKPISIFGLFNVTALIGGLLLLTIPPNPSAPTTLVLAVTALPHGATATLPGEDSLSQELRTVRLLRPHVLVGYWR
jgi:hypothetical protein